jgi:hypothetical protein
MGDAAAPDGGSKRRRVYWRLEIEALKGSPSLEAQAQLWAEVYSSLAAAGFAVEERRNRRGNKGKGPEEVAGGGGGGGRKAPRFLGTAPLLASDSENPSSVKKMWCRCVFFFLQMLSVTGSGGMGICGFVMTVDRRLFRSLLGCTVRFRNPLMRVK